MPKLHESIAVLSGKKAEAEKRITEIYHRVQKPELFDGLQKTYQPLEEGGEQLPPESKLPQAVLRDEVARARKIWAELFDAVLAVDAGNQKAKADLIVDGRVVVKDVPVPTLLFLEKTLDAQVETLVEKLPVPDSAEKWTPDPVKGYLATEQLKTSRTKKVPKVITLAKATDKHPEQAQLVHEDVQAGLWSTVKYSTKIEASQKEELLARIAKLKDAVKVARERANATEVEAPRMGEEIFKYLLAGYLKS